ncbi:MAG: hypothetical protein HYS63_05915 [Methylocystis sp.]|nr:hypothetical protein [Methylocystis sp.]
MNGADVIPDARDVRDRESRAKPAFLDWLWIPGQAFGLPGMTWSKRTDQPETVWNRSTYPHVGDAAQMQRDRVQAARSSARTILNHA